MRSLSFGLHVAVWDTALHLSIYPVHWMFGIQNGDGLTNIALGPFRMLLQPQLWNDHAEAGK